MFGSTHIKRYTKIGVLELSSPSTRLFYSQGLKKCVLSVLNPRNDWGRRGLFFKEFHMKTQTTFTYEIFQNQLPSPQKSHFGAFQSGKQFSQFHCGQNIGGFHLVLDFNHTPYGCYTLRTGGLHRPVKYVKFTVITFEI